MSILVGAAVLLGGVIAVFAIRSRNLQYWLGAYLRQLPGRSRRSLSGTIIYVCFADHYEPFQGGNDSRHARETVNRWRLEYPKIASRHTDSVGRKPVHSFFYPIEEYDEEVIETLKGLVDEGLADIEVHYHHDNDTAESLDRALREFTHTLIERHGLLRRDRNDDPKYCFIHGNWSLDNSRPDGKWCGVTNELSVLVSSGCVMDMTMPSAPSDTQTRKINSIYAAKGVDGKCKSHDTGRDIEVGRWVEPGELLLVQGPLALNWRSRKAGLLPRVENGEVSHDAPSTPDRVRLWLRFAPSLPGAEKHVFLKLHTHGAQEETSDMLLADGFDRLWSDIEAEIRDQPGMTLRYVSAWEMYKRIRELAIESR